jgi:hypothetical protein
MPNSLLISFQLLLLWLDNFVASRIEEFWNKIIPVQMNEFM